MNTLISDRLEAVFDEASVLPRDERDEFLQSACKGDSGLRHAVEALLASADEADAFFSGLGERLGLQSVLDGTIDLPREERIGSYRLLRLIARGGMGAVYLAERADQQFEKQVALKVLPVGIGGDAVRERFIAERQILARLVHPNIARLLDGGITGSNTPYFVMDYVDGEPIDEHCDRQRLAMDARLALFTQVAAAVDYAHRNLVVHRDIKPSNVLVDRAGDVKLLDFGVAKLLLPTADDAMLTRVSGRPMTLGFASPETIRGEPVSVAADVYSLGVLLYLLLTGRHPFPDAGDSPATMERRIVEQDCPLPSQAAVLNDEAGSHFGVSPRELSQRLKGDLDTIVMKCLQADGEQRYSTVEQLIADLHRHRDRLPVSARPPSLVYRSRKFIRRHTAAVATAMTVVVALLAVASLATVNAITSARQAREIAVERDRAEDINTFLLSIFELSGPNQTKGETVTAIELLARGAERVRTELGDQPQRQATLMHSIAEVYSQLSLFDKARPLLEEAVTLHRQAGTDTSLEFRRTLEDLAAVNEVEGSLDAADTLMRQLIELQRSGDDAELAGSLLVLGRIQHKMGNVGEAEELYRSGLDLHGGRSGSGTDEVARGLSYLGSLLEQRGALQEAEVMHRDALGIRRALYGEQHINLVESHHNLGATLLGQERFAEAREHFELALAISQQLLPQGSQGKGFLYNGLGRVLEATGELDLALENYALSIDMFRRFLGEEHFNVGIVTGRLGGVLLQQGKHESAEATLREGIRILAAALPTHRMLPRMRLNLGLCLARTAQFEEAESLLLAVYEQEELPAGQDEIRRTSLEGIVELYDAWGQPVRAARYRAELSDLPAP